MSVTRADSRINADDRGLFASQEGTIDDTLSFDDLVNLMIVMLASKKRTAARDMSLATWMTMTIGRGDDARLVFLPDLLKPLYLRVLGEHCSVDSTCLPELHSLLESANGMQDLAHLHLSTHLLPKKIAHSLLLNCCCARPLPHLSGVSCAAWRQTAVWREGGVCWCDPQC